jgi:hypothetical protein
MDDELWDAIMDGFTPRQLQKEAARAICTMPADNDSKHKFNAVARHNSNLWYKAVIKYYINEHGDFPSEVGPGKDIKLILDD